MALFETFPYTNFQDLNLDMLLNHMRNLLKAMKELDALVNGYEDRIQTLENYIKDLEEGNFSDAFLTKLYRWLDENAPEIFYRCVKMVWFGLTDTGYFIAYVPESWQDIQFNTTNYDIETDLMPEYGHLVLSTKGAYRTWQ